MSQELLSSGLRFKDKVVIVTGGTSGIGEGCVRVFARNGGKVVFCAIGENEGKSLEAELNATNIGEVAYVACDVRKEDQIKNLVEKTLLRFGRIDCVINNAGWHPPMKFIDDFSAEEFRSLLELNVMSCFLMAKYSLPTLRQTHGSIINTSSLVATIGQGKAVTYCATKGAVSAMTRALAIDEARHNVRVNAFSPGNVYTPMWSSLAQLELNAQSAVEEGANQQPLGRFGTPEECGELCLYLASAGTFLTGLDIPISGGAELDYGNKATWK